MATAANNKIKIIKKKEKTLARTNINTQRKQCSNKPYSGNNYKWQHIEAILSLISI